MPRAAQQEKDKGTTAVQEQPTATEGLEPPKTVATVPRPTPLTQAAGYDIAGVGTGFEDFTQEDLAVPFLVILQKGSPQVEEENSKYVAGAKAGMLMDTVTNELFDGKTGVRVIPVHRTRTFIEWIPKDDGGGLVNVFAPDAPEVLAVLKKAGRKFGKLKIGDNNDLVETFNVFCLLLLPTGGTKRVVVGFASSQIGMYKKWMTTAQSIQIQAEEGGRATTPPMFSHVYRLTTIFFQGKEHTWYKWVARFDGADASAARLTNEDPLCVEAKEFRALILGGRATANFASAQQDGDVAEAEFEM